METNRQTNLDGPYLKIEQLDASLASPGSIVMGDLVFSAMLTNLMPRPILEGKICIVIIRDTIPTPFALAFGRIDPGVKFLWTRIQTGVGNPSTGFKWAFSWAEIMMESTRLSEVPIATYIYSTTLTSAFVYTYTTAYTMNEPISQASWPIVLPLLVVAGVVVLVLTISYSKKKRQPTPPKPVKEKTLPQKPMEEKKLPEDESAKIPVFIAKLEELKQSDKISDQAYEKLKKEYWEKAQKLTGKITEREFARAGFVFCHYCGAQIPRSAEFCRECGKPQKQIHNTGS